MTAILVIYHSQGGNTRKLAKSVAAGAAAIENVQVSLKRAGNATFDDLINCDGLAIGSPEYFGTMAGMIKDFFDRTYHRAVHSPKIFKKPYALFISAGNDGRGARNQIERICLGYPFKKIAETLIVRGEPGQDDLSRCYELGQTIAAGCEAGIY